MKIRMSIFDGESGKFLESKEFNEKETIEELKKGNAVEIYDEVTNLIVPNMSGNRIETNFDGFANLKKEK